MSLEINDSSLIACLCEGSAEQAVMDLLLDSDSLIFSRDRLIEERPIRVRNARNFEDRYLRYDFGEPITVLRILDSRHENFILRKAYRHQVGRIYDIITAPEIEILIIISEGQYDAFTNKYKNQLKPSEYCKQNLRLGREVKQYHSVIDYFQDTEKLKKAIRKYAQYQKQEEYCLKDLLKCPE